MGIKVEFSFADGGLRAALKRAEAAGIDLGDPLRASGALLESSTRERFDTGIGPDGAAWKLSKRVIEHGGKTLRDRGNLLDSITYVVREAEREVEVGSDGRRDSAKYAHVHQFGYSETHQVKGHTRLIVQAFGAELKFGVYQTVKDHTRKANLPARPFIGISDTDMLDLTELWNDYIAGTFK